jgi:hypothetical protein
VVVDDVEGAGGVEVVVDVVVGSLGVVVSAPPPSPAQAAAIKTSTAKTAT